MKEEKYAHPLMSDEEIKERSIAIDKLVTRLKKECGAYLEKAKASSAETIYENAERIAIAKNLKERANLHREFFSQLSLAELDMLVDYKGDLAAKIAHNIVDCSVAMVDGYTDAINESITEIVKAK